MVVTFIDNEDLGKAAPLIIKMQNFVVKNFYDDMLTLTIKITLYTVVGVILYMLFKREPLIWKIIDTVILF